MVVGTVNHLIEVIDSSIHTTLSVLLAFRDYELNGYKNKLETIKPLINTGQEYLLRKRLFKRETNG